MMLLVTDPPFVGALLEPCIAHASAYAIALAEAGADMLSTGDSPAGMVGPDLYQEFALPAGRRVFDAIHAACDVPASLHTTDGPSRALILNFRPAEMIRLERELGFVHGKSGNVRVNRNTRTK